ncbi:hypothetical protein HOY82DRAFT_601525 [Tuber indicum]|nr:hypothetical protein HOY82DRAFT_601525 [Tuber indicum]
MTHVVRAYTGNSGACPFVLVLIQVPLRFLVDNMMLVIVVVAIGTAVNIIVVPKVITVITIAISELYPESRTVIPSGQSRPWSGPWTSSPASPAVVSKSLGQSGRNSGRPPKPGGAQATAGSSLGATLAKAVRCPGKAARYPENQKLSAKGQSA